MAQYISVYAATCQNRTEGGLEHTFKANMNLNL